MSSMKFGSIKLTKSIPMEPPKLTFVYAIFMYFQKMAGTFFLRRNHYLNTEGPQTPVTTWYKPYYYDMVDPETTSEWITLPSSIYIKCLAA